MYLAKYHEIVIYHLINIDSVYVIDNINVNVATREFEIINEYRCIYIITSLLIKLYICI